MICGVSHTPTFGTAFNVLLIKDSVSSGLQLALLVGSETNNMALTRRRFSRAVGVAGTAFAADSLKLNASTSKMSKRPNLLIIMTDQQRYDALSIAGNKVLTTPHMDSIGKAGAYFSRALCHSPVCAPARAAFLTGHNIENTGIRTNSAVFLPESDGLCQQVTFDEVLAKNGYYSEYHGKYHSPTYRAGGYQRFEYTERNGRFTMKSESDFRRVFIPSKVKKMAPVLGQQIDSYYGLPYTMDPIDSRFGLPPTNQIPAKNGTSDRVLQPDNLGRLDIPVDATVTAYQAQKTIDAIKRASALSQPFNITCSLHCPHAPLIVTQPYYSMYPADEMVSPESINDAMENSPYRNANWRTRRTQFQDPQLIKYMISNYYGLVKECDDWVGKILATLKSLGLEENTLVIFSSDHGEMLGSHGMREKNVFFEESVRVPLMLRMPGKIAAGTAVDVPVDHLDIFSTILDYMGIDELPSDGSSLRSIVEGVVPKAEKYAVSEWNYDLAGNNINVPNFCLRTKNWKLMMSRGAKTIDCLFDLKNDPHEMNNLIGNNKEKGRYAEKANHMKSLLLKYMAKVNHPHVVGISKKVLVEEKPFWNMPFG
jgi:arylsulfatase A-like enzyme